MAIDTKLDWNGDQKSLDMKNAMVKFLIRGTNFVQSDAKLRVTVDTGNLRSSIVKNVDTNDLIGTVSTNVEYARYVEFGLKSNPNYPKQPFLRPAVNENQDVLLKIAISEGVKGVNK